MPGLQALIVPHLRGVAGRVRSLHEAPEWIVTIAPNTGMRLGEILNLTWGQIDLQQGYITVVKTKSGKTGIIPIDEAVSTVLKSRTKV